MFKKALKHTGRSGVRAMAVKQTDKRAGKAFVKKTAKRAGKAFVKKTASTAKSAGKSGGKKVAWNVKTKRGNHSTGIGVGY